MSDENTTPRRVAPEGPVPEDRVPEPEATRDVEVTDDTDDTVLLEQHPPTTELPSQPSVAERVPSTAGPLASPAPPLATAAEPLATAAEPVPSPVERTSGAGVVTPPGGLVTVRTGPRPGAMVLGVICLLVAAYTMARQTMDWRFDLSLVGPISIGALGTLLLLVGLVGLLSRRRS